MIVTLRTPSRGREDDADVGVVVEQDQSIPPAGPDRATSVVADSNDVGDVRRAAGAGGAEGDELGAGPAGEVVEVYPGKCPAVVGAYGGPHGVDAVLTRSRVGGRVDIVLRASSTRAISSSSSTSEAGRDAVMAVTVVRACHPCRPRRALSAGGGG